MTGLDEYGDDYELPAEPEQRQSFRLLNDRMLDWCLRRLAVKARKRLDIAARAQAEVDRIRAWEKDEDAKLAGDADYLRSLAEEYALAERARTAHLHERDQRKSISTPYGDVSTVKRSTGKWELEANGTVFLDWLRVHNRPDLIREKYSEEPDLAACKKAFGNTVQDGLIHDPDSGEAIPGVKVGDPVVSVTVSPDLALHVEDEEDRHVER